MDMNQTTPTAAPAKRRIKKWPIIVAAALVPVILSVIACVLFLPLLRRDTVTPALLDYFPEGAALTELVKRQEGKSTETELELRVPRNLLSTEEDLTVSLTETLIPQDDRLRFSLSLTAALGDYQHELSLIKSEDRFAVKGLLDDGYLTLDADDFEEELAQSILHPDRKTGYELNEDSYNRLLELLETLQNPQEKREEELEVILEAAENIYEMCAHVLEPETEIVWKAGGFGLQKTERLHLDSGKLREILKAAKQELYDNNDLRALIREKSNEMDFELSVGILKELNDALGDLIKTKELGTLIVEIVSEQGVATLVQVSYERGTEFFFDFRFSEDGIELKTVRHESGQVTVNNFLTTKGETKTETALRIFRREEEDCVQHHASFHVECAVTPKGLATTTTVTDYAVEAVYRKSSGGYQMTVTGPGDEAGESVSLLITGTARLDSGEQALSFTVDDASLQGRSIFEADSLVELSAREGQARSLLRLTHRTAKKAKITAPEGRSIAELTAAEANAFKKSFPLEEIGVWMQKYAETQALKSIPFHVQVHINRNRVLSEEQIAYLKARYGEAMIDYVRSLVQSGSMREIDFPLQYCLYDEEMDFIVSVTLFYFSTSDVNSITIEVSDPSDPKDVQGFRYDCHGELTESGEWIPHTLHFSIRKEQDVNEYGYTEYKCDQCDYYYRMWIPPQIY